MSGYCCKRSSARTNIIKVYGKWTLPTACAGVYSTSDTSYNIVPEMFFGFYDPTGNIGFDLGILHTGGSQWRACYSGYTGTNSVEWDDSDNTFSLTLGSTIYANGWVEKVSGKWYAKLNLSRVGYDYSDIIYFEHEINNSSVKNQCESGFRVNREIAIAVNDNAVSYYESRNCYIHNATYTEHTLIEKNGAYCRWTDSESIDIANVLPWNGGIYECDYENATGKSNALELRKDEGDVVSKYISAECGNTTVGGETYSSECVTIQFGI